MPRNHQDWDDPDDFDFDDEDDKEDDPDDWTVEQWEADLKRRDERDRKMMELLDKYGHDEAGFRKAMEELGLGKIYEDMDRLAAEQQDQPEEDDEEEDDEEKIDKVLRESRYANDDLRKAGFRDPLGQTAHELTLMVLKSLEGHDEIDSREHPLALYSGAFLDAQGGLARMGYMRKWDDEFHFSPAKNLKIAELKRVVKNLVKGLGQLETVERQKLLAPKVCAPIHQQAVALLDGVREELRRLKSK
jgi:hypothetical protein